MKPFHSILTSLTLLVTAAVSANNIQVANPTLTGNTGTSAQVQFDLSWENSWRGGGVNNWDAAWVFVKYRSSATGPWQHANLNNTGHVPAAGSQIDLGLLTPGGIYNANTNPVMGVFVSRDVAGSGNLSLPNTQLNWNYAAQGLAFNNIFEVQVFAVEMVYVNQGAFAAGSGGTEVGAFTLTTINTGNATVPPSGTGSLGGQAGGYPTGQTAPASFNWPNGFSAFYCMKYEVSQQGYVDFLNTLSYDQQVTRTAIAPNSVAGNGALIFSYQARNGIIIQTPGVASTTPAVYACNLNVNTTYGEATDGKDVACSWLSWRDLLAYLDWSGLRPMTELEFEKACRGTIAPVPNEYPWGSTGLAGSIYTLANAGASNEGIATNYSTTLGNVNYVSTGSQAADGGPLRVGIFAANGSNNSRATAGASYYGIMELGGNLYERVVNIGYVEGRAFTGAHGNGALAVDGNPNVTSWPTDNTGFGIGLRGGAWNIDLAQLRVSDRANAFFGVTSRTNNTGGRGVRLAP